MTPSGWPRVRLKDLGTWFGGGTPSKSNGGFWTDGTVPWLSPKDMGPEVLAGTQDHITQDAVENSSVKRVPAGSVALVVRSGILERTLPVALVPFDTTLNQDMKAVAARPDIDARWIAWGLRASEQEILCTCRKTGTTVASMEMPRLYEHTIPVPPLEEQRGIVDILEDHLSRLDASDSLLTTALRRLQVLHKSVLLDLIPDANAYPVHWNQSTVSEAGNVTLGRQRHPDWHNGPNMHPYLRVANVFEDRIDLSDVKEMHWPGDSFNRFRLKPGDLLLNEGQSPEFLGRPAMYTGTPVDIAFTNTLIRFQANERVLPEFALLVFRRHMHAGRFAQESRITTNIAHLSASRLKPIEFPIPPLDEQKQLAGLAEQQLGDAARLGDQVRLLKLKSKVLRRALLGAAFSGHLTGRSTDMEILEEMARV